MLIILFTEILAISGIVYAVSSYSFIAQNFLLFTLPFLITLALPLYVGLKVRRRNQTSNDLDDIDHEVLEEAERRAAKVDRRAELAKAHECIATFDSLKGYDHTVMADFIAKMREHNISSDYIFIETLPTGYASYMGGTGVFEFFVESAKREQAEQVLAKIMVS